MYLQITTRCNMLCEHCGFSCTARGVDMSLAVAKAALAWEEPTCIGGGEPTVHPAFFEILSLALGYGDGPPDIATNGKLTDAALMLLRLARKKLVSVRLAIDEFHEQIDREVIEQYLSAGKKGAYARVVDSDPIAVGRWAGNGVRDDNEERCICDDLFVCPDGTVKMCGCHDAPVLGHVFRDDPFTSEGCWRMQARDFKLEGGVKAARLTEVEAISRVMEERYGRKF